MLVTNFKERGQKRAAFLFDLAAAPTMGDFV